MPDRLDFALAELQGLLKSPPPTPPAYGYYAAVASLAWRAERSEARAVLPVLREAALSCRETTGSEVLTANVLAGLGRVQFLAGEDAVVALSNLRQSVQLAAGPAPHFFRAEILRRRGDLDAAKAAWQSFSKDEQWRKVAKESQKDGRFLREKPGSVYLKATDYSALK